MRDNQKIYLYHPLLRYQMETELEVDSNSKIADDIMRSLLSSYTIDEIMDLVMKNRDKPVYVCVKRGKPDSAKIFVDSNGKHCYRCDETLLVPIPKKFVILEPDKMYFEMTLRANLLLALKGAEEKELHH